MPLELHSYWEISCDKCGVKHEDTYELQYDVGCSAQSNGWWIGFLLCLSTDKDADQICCPKCRKEKDNAP